MMKTPVGTTKPVTTDEGKHLSQSDEFMKCLVFQQDERPQTTQKQPVHRPHTANRGFPHCHFRGLIEIKMLDFTSKFQEYLKAVDVVSSNGYIKIRESTPRVASSPTKWRGPGRELKADPCYTEGIKAQAGRFPHNNWNLPVWAFSYSNVPLNPFPSGDHP